MTPYYNKPPQRGLIAHFSAVADATELPVMLYNIPGRTALRIEHDTLLELAAHPNIVAVKDSTGDFQAVSRLIAEAPDGFEVYSGDDWATFGYLCLGAVGVVSVASHLVGTQIHQMVDLIVDRRHPGGPQDPRAARPAVQRDVHHLEPDPRQGGAADARPRVWRHAAAARGGHSR